MVAELQNKRVIAFVDGQNLFNAAKQAFGYDYPNYDAVKLAQLVCEKRGQALGERWTLVKLHFYTGMPSPTKDEPRNRFWKSKLGAMGMKKPLVQTFSRPLVYRNGIGQEKGIDVRLALDAVRLAHENEYDVALIFSQDQDFRAYQELIWTEVLEFCNLSLLDIERLFHGGILWRNPIPLIYANRY